MTTQTDQSLRERVQRADGQCVCPACDGAAFDGMDAWIEHVSDEHDPYKEFVARWGGQ